MDLLRQIWLRAPLSVLPSIEGVIDDDWFRQRNRVVNRLPEAAFEEYLERLMHIAKTRVVAYISLSVLQGDRPPDDLPILYSRYLFARAAFLRDPKMYEAACRYHTEVDLDLALISDVPEIQAWALALTNDPWIIPDPEIIRWTPHLIRYYTSLPNQIPELLGYFHAPSKKSLMYMIGYLKNSVHRKASTSKSETALNSYLATISPRLGNPLDHVLQICAASGYFSPQLLKVEDKTLVIIAIRSIHPSWIVRLPRVAIDDDVHFGIGDITVDLVERAKEMIPLIERYYPNLKLYLTELRILCGLEIDPNYINRNTDLLLQTVAHPQLEVVTNQRIYSSVHYDLSRLIRLSGRQNVTRSFALVSARGGLLGIYQSWLDHSHKTPGDLSETSPEIRQKYERILAMLK